MTRTAISALLLVLISACGVLGAEPRGIAELLTALKGEDSRFEAIRDLEDLGLDAAPAVPQLIRLLDARDQPTRLAAADALEAIGKDATAAIPKLVERLGEGDLLRTPMDVSSTAVGVHAAFALSKMGKDAVALLVPCLASQHAAMRSNAAYALGMIGPDAKDAVTPLIGRLKDRAWLVRHCAAEALGSIGSEPHQTIPALIESLKDENLHVREAAAAALGAIRPTTPASVEGLMRALDDKEGNVQHEAAQALAKLGADAVPAIPSLVKMLKSREMFVEGVPGGFMPVARTAARALGAIGPKARNALPIILDFVRYTKGTFDVFGSSEHNYEVRAEAAVAAARIDPQCDELVRVLGRSLAEDDWIRGKVAVALALVGEKAKGMVPLLIQFTEPNRRFPYELQCACAAVAIEPDNPVAVRKMLDHLPPAPGPFDDDDWALLRTALVRAGARSRPAIPILITVLKDNSEDQENAVRTLATFGPEAASAIPALLTLLSERWEHPRQDAIAALQHIASEKSALLQAALKHNDANIRAGVAEVLGHYPGAVPLLTEATNDPSARVRLAALLSLAKLDGNAKAAVSQIRKLLRDDFRTIREAAAKALKQLGDD